MQGTVSTKRTLKLGSLLYYMLFHFVAFSTCSTAKIMKHQRRRSVTLKNGCVSLIEPRSAKMKHILGIHD